MTQTRGHCTVSTCGYLRIGRVAMQSFIQNVCDILVAPASRIRTTRYLVPNITQAAGNYVAQRDCFTTNVNDKLVIRRNADEIAFKALRLGSVPSYDRRGN